MLQRRDLIRGLGALPLAAVLADPRLARAVADTLDTVEIDTSDGRTVSAALALPDAARAPAVLLIHEWWGLNDQIKSVAADFARLGYMALAVDLMDGKVATTPEEAQKLTRAVDPAEARTTLVDWADWIRAHHAFGGRIGTVGWCFGGGWSLDASIATPVDATVIYYGRVTNPASELAALKGPVLGHFATEDRFIDKPMVNGFVDEMAKAGKELTVYWYEADHAFANPTSARYDSADAKSAWERTKTFFAQNLGS